MNEGIPRPLLNSLQLSSSLPFMSASRITSKNQRKHSPRRARMSALAANTDNPAHPAEDTEKPFIGQQSGDADARAISVNDHAPNAIGAQAAPEPAEAAMNQRPRAENELKTNVVGAAFSVPQCIPLPNSVMRGDVDAPYYENWAREYSCQVR